MTKDDVEKITKGMSAMRSKNMTIQYRDDKLQFRFSDDAGDILNFRVNSEVNSDKDDSSFSVTINLRKMSPIFKIAAQHMDNFNLNILKNNILHLVIDGVEVLIMPEV